MHMKVMKNLSRRWWGYFVPFITRKWEVCVHINLRLIFVWDPTAHSASPCSQSNAAHCQLWPCSAQLVQQKRHSCCVAVQRQHWGIPISFILPALLQPCPIQLISKVGLLRMCGRSSTLGLCGAQCAHTAVPGCRHPICWGWGGSRSSAGGHATARSFQRSGQMVWILLKSLSPRQERASTNKSPKTLSVFSPAPAFKSLLLSHPSQTPLSSGSSLCLQLFQFISESFNVSSYYDASIYYSNVGKKPCMREGKERRL